VNIYLLAGKNDRFILPLLDYFGKMRVADITGPLVRKAAAEIYPGRSAATWNRQVIGPVRAIINHAADAGKAQKITINRFKEERTRRPAGDRKWLDSFVAKAKSLNMPETAALARFLFETAARISEACRLDWKDVDLAEGEAWLAKTKTEPRKVFLTRRMVADLANLSDRHPRLVFKAANRSTARKRFDKVIVAAGLARLTSHEFGRHGFATEMIVRNGIDAATTGDLGGWKSRRLLMETYVDGDGDRGVIDRVFGKKG
jgi:integrase